MNFRVDIAVDHHVCGARFNHTCLILTNEWRCIVTAYIVPLGIGTGRMFHTILEVTSSQTMPIADKIISVCIIIVELNIDFRDCMNMI